MTAARPAPPEPIPGSAFPGPWPVGRYAAGLRQKLREMSRVQVFGEVWGLQVRRAKVFFELRDAGGALPCSMWRDDWERQGPAGLTDGTRVVVGGGPDYYTGSANASPAFTFLCRELRAAGEGDLLAQVDRSRKALAAAGLLGRQRALPRRPLPRTIGVVCGAGSKAHDDVLAGLRRQGWGGRLVWAHAPVQDVHAAPRIGRALQDLVAYAAPDVIVVARGGGSLADLFAFCDETLCRTVALLPVPVICSVGHHTDRTLLDDVAAESCSTPTHAAQAAVPLDCAAARRELHGRARRLRDHARRSVLERARALARLSRAPAEHVARHRRALHQGLRELRASARRGLARRDEAGRTYATVLERKAGATAVAVARRRDLDRLALALSAHDPERTLARGYALVHDGDGTPLTSAAEARAAGRGRVRFADGDTEATFT